MMIIGYPYLLPLLRVLSVLSVASKRLVSRPMRPVLPALLVIHGSSTQHLLSLGDLLREWAVRNLEGVRR